MCYVKNIVINHFFSVNLISIKIKSHINFKVNIIIEMSQVEKL